MIFRPSFLDPQYNKSPWFGQSNAQAASSPMGGPQMANTDFRPGSNVSVPSNHIDPQSSYDRSKARFDQNNQDDGLFGSGMSASDMLGVAGMVAGAAGGGGVSTGTIDAANKASSATKALAGPMGGPGASGAAMQAANASASSTGSLGANFSAAGGLQGGAGVADRSLWDRMSSTFTPKEQPTNIPSMARPGGGPAGGISETRAAAGGMFPGMQYRTPDFNPYAQQQRTGGLGGMWGLGGGYFY